MLAKNNKPLVDALQEIDMCFEAAYVEGLCEKINNDEALADLINRRLLPARDIAIKALKQYEDV